MKKKLVSLASVCKVREHPSEIIQIKKNFIKFLIKNKYKNDQR